MQRNQQNLVWWIERHMYCIFDKEQGIFQIGFRTFSSLNPLHGLFIDKEIKENEGDSSIFYTHKNVFKHDALFEKDFRIEIKNRFVKNFIDAAMKALQKMGKKRKSKKKLILRVLFYFALAACAFFYHFSLFNLKKSEKTEDPISHFEKMEDILFQTKLAEDISQFRDSYYPFLPLKPKGISDFQVIPIGRHEAKENPYKGYLATSFSSIVTVKENHIAYRKSPIKSCEYNNSITKNIFEISDDDQIVLLDLKKKIFLLKEGESILFSKNYFSEDSMCDYLNLDPENTLEQKKENERR